MALLLIQVLMAVMRNTAARVEGRRALPPSRTLAVRLFLVVQQVAVGHRLLPQMLRKLVHPAVLSIHTLLVAVALAALLRALPDRLGRQGQMDFAAPAEAVVAAELALAELVGLVARQAAEVVEAQRR